MISPDRQFLWVAKKGNEKKITVIATPLAEIFDQLIHFEDAPYQIALGLIGGEGNVLAGERKEGPLQILLPIEGASFSLVLSADEASIHDLQKQIYLFRFITFFFFVGILGGILVWILMRRVSLPLKSLCTAMERIEKGAVHIRYKKDWLGFEINSLGARFNQMLDAMLLHAQEIEKERLARERLAEELRIGREIQLALLPSHLPNLPGIDIESGFLPAMEVSGDFYDLIVLENGSLLIVIADTAGKGVSACLYSLGLRSSLRALSTQNLDLSEIVLRANDLFLRDAKDSGVFTTLWAAIYTPSSRSLVYCSQGHPPAALLRKGKIEKLWTAGISLGAQTLDAVTVKTIQLHSHDLLVLYTDGIIEAHTPDKVLFGQERFFELLVKLAKLPLIQIKDQILEEISSFQDGAVQHDDIAFVLIRNYSIS